MSVVVHGSLVAGVLLGARGAATALPPVYRVELIAAPAGPRAVGAVTEAPPPAATPAAPPKRPETVAKDAVAAKKRPVTRKAPEKATPTPDARASRRTEPAPKAGGGPEGGKGADVANVKTEGAEFLDQMYLNNIVRQIALRFKPKNAGVLRAEVVFLIRRDGSVFGSTLRQASGSMLFDLEALGAIEGAANAKSFGALPNSWADDVLTVIFTFDPKLIR